MTIGPVRAAYVAEPLKPFVLCLADGRKILVVRREFMALSPSGRSIVIYQDDDSSNFIDLSLVTDLKFQRPKSGGSKGSK